jgi:RND family efflux transporter MFP subunit
MPSAKIRLIAMMSDFIVSYPWKEGDEISKNSVVAVIRKSGIQYGLDQLGAQGIGLDVQIANLKSEVARTTDLFGKGVATRQMLDQVTAQYEATLAQKNALSAGKAQLAVAAGNAVVKAPVEGILSSKMYEEGDIASPALPLGILLVVDPLKLELKLVEKDVTRVKDGQTVELKLDAYPGRVFTGTISRIFPYIDGATRTNTVEVNLPNPRGEDGQRELKPGMFGTASLVVERRTDVVTVSENALLLDNKLIAIQKAGEDLRKAFVVDDAGIAHERTVRLGARKGSSWEILDGLKVGEKIVTRGQHGLSDGKKVVVVSSVGDEDKAVPAATTTAVEASK